MDLCKTIFKNLPLKRYLKFFRMIQDFMEIQKSWRMPAVNVRKFTVVLRVFVEFF